jgi:hypothetical protein
MATVVVEGVSRLLSPSMRCGVERAAAAFDAVWLTAASRAVLMSVVAVVVQLRVRPRASFGV